MDFFSTKQKSVRVCVSEGQRHRLGECTKFLKHKLSTFHAFTQLPITEVIEKKCTIIPF